MAKEEALELEEVPEENAEYNFDFENQVEEVPEVETLEEVTPEINSEPEVLEEATPEAEEEEPVEELEEAPAEEEIVELVDSKSTIRFGIVLLLIVVIFIIALPFIMKFLG